MLSGLLCPFSSLCKSGQQSIISHFFVSFFVSFDVIYPLLSHPWYSMYLGIKYQHLTLLCFLDDQRRHIRNSGLHFQHVQSLSFNKNQQLSMGTLTFSASDLTDACTLQNLGTHRSPEVTILLPNSEQMHDWHSALWSMTPGLKGSAFLCLSRR